MGTPRATIDRDRPAFYSVDDADVGPFDGFESGDPDLDDFVRSDAARLQACRIARTYVAKYDDAVVGYVALTNDSIQLTSGERKKLKAPESTARLQHGDPSVVPAVKVRRLAACQRFRENNEGIGRELVLLAGLAALRVSQRVGCRLLTVDAYPQSAAFYVRLGFVSNKRAEDTETDGADSVRKNPSYRLDLFSDSARWILEDERTG